MPAEAPFVSGLTFTPADAAARESGLLGFIACTVGGRLRLDGIGLRRTRGGSLTLSFPERRDRTGRAHAYIRPLDNATRLTIEAEVFAALGIEQEPTP